MPAFVFEQRSNERLAHESGFQADKDTTLAPQSPFQKEYPTFYVRAPLPLGIDMIASIKGRTPDHTLTTGIK